MRRAHPRRQLCRELTVHVLRPRHHRTAEACADAILQQPTACDALELDAGVPPLRLDLRRSEREVEQEVDQLLPLCGRAVLVDVLEGGNGEERDGGSLVCAGGHAANDALVEGDGEAAPQRDQQSNPYARTGRAARTTGDRSAAWRR
jgi:hypothetical protein